MQVHAYFMPDVVIKIIELVKDNEELLLNLRKTQFEEKELEEKINIRKATLHESEIEDLIDYEWIQWESVCMVKEFFESEKISNTGGFNIFYFFTNYMNGNNE